MKVRTRSIPFVSKSKRQYTHQSFETSTPKVENLSIQLTFAKVQWISIKLLEFGSHLSIEVAG